MKNHKLQEVEPVCDGPGGVVIGTIEASEGHVLKATSEPLLEEVVDAAAELGPVGVVGDGVNVNTSPSVEITVGEVSPVGTASVSEPPITIMPPEDTIVCPDGSVKVVAACPMEPVRETHPY